MCDCKKCKNYKDVLAGTRAAADTKYCDIADIHLINGMNIEDGDCKFYKEQSELLKIRYHADIDPIKKINIGDMIDLRAAEDVRLEYGDYAEISLGVSMQIPKGYEAHVYPRSSTFKKYGIILVNGVGIIDESYCGDNDVWKFPVYATRATRIKKNERIAQFRLFKHQEDFEVATVDRLDNEDRGGFGSTGRM